MIKAALTALKERGGSSRQAILKYIAKNYNVGHDEKVINQHLKMSLRAGVKNGSLKQSKGSGASGSFRLGEAAKKSPAKAKKPKKAKKPAGEKKAKSPKKKSPKKAKDAKPKKVPPSQRRLSPSRRRLPLNQRRQQNRRRPLPRRRRPQPRIEKVHSE
ncbi:hypothetical protein LSH36_487g00044 [Paralvinella palmiformis]|uniref:H15 domain-containing protein n=1 Tax=Paralvinella palmiformis TaxID=53620 RepID=A0AAD9J9G3_9ANNE|nr:hypothetical protein LSH36_487g00044 [Paralvinella palmiformis]